MPNKLKIRTPHAAVVVWNYENRLGSEITKDDKERDGISTTIVSTLSILSIRTTKNKNDPAGTFEITLAPTKNWISHIAAGSWLAIMMGNDPIKKEDISKVNPRLLKMIGRVDSVRLSMNSDPQTGANKSTYIVSGQDWGQVFNGIIYVDPLVGAGDAPETAAIKMNLNSTIVDKDGNVNLKLTRDLLATIKDFWGLPLRELQEKFREARVIADSGISFVLPRELVKFLNQGDSTRKISDVVTIVSGKLEGDDASISSYANVSDSSGFLNPADLYGANTVWQIMQAHANPIINEMYCDMSLVGNTAELNLYNRVKPFLIRPIEGEDVSEKDRQTISSLSSPFRLIKQTAIPKEEIITIDVGTNWRDKFNFAEIRPGWADVRGLDTEFKSKTQIADRVAFGREGFRPRIEVTKQYPVNINKEPIVALVSAWKYLMRAWYFDTHRMLNGALTMPGPNYYIEVGSNVMVDVGVLGPSFNMTKQSNIVQGGYLLAHVEGVSHTFNNLPDGSRSYITVVQFVRGIVTDAKGRPIGDVGRLDTKSNRLSKQDLLNETVIGLSSDNSNHKEIK